MDGPFATRTARAIGAALERTARVLQRSAGGERDGDRRRRAPLQEAHQLVAVQAGHLQVAEDDLRRMRVELRQRRLGPVCLEHLRSGCPQGQGDELERLWFVFHHQNPDTGELVASQLIDRHVQCGS